MSDWLHNLPLVWMALAVFGFTYLTASIIQVVVMVLAIGERAHAFKAVSPGVLSPLGILFALFVAFTASQVWNDTERANTAVAHEASALSTILFLAVSFPGEPQAEMSALIRRYVEEAANREWPLMAQENAALPITPKPLAEALGLALALTPGNKGQETAQREITTALGEALEARRQRIIISRSQVNLVKWSCLFVQAIATFLTIAMVHCDNRVAASLAMAVFAAGVAASLLLIASHDRPFTGDISVRPDPLLHVMPEIEASRK